MKDKRTRCVSYFCQNLHTSMTFVLGKKACVNHANICVSVRLCVCISTKTTVLITANWRDVLTPALCSGEASAPVMKASVTATLSPGPHTAAAVTLSAVLCNDL